MIYIFWTCRDLAEAQSIIHKLLTKHLIACGSIFPEVVSIYRWEGKIEESREVKVILKTMPCHFDAIQDLIKTSCSYQVPEIVMLNVVTGNQDYISWIEKETAFLK